MNNKNATQIRSRISRTRNILRKSNLQGFIQPRSDSYLGEYIPKSSARLEWLTGFSGSAGEFLLTQNKTLLFVDSRYTLQATKQTKNTGITILLITEISLIQWLRSNMKKKLSIGFHNWLYSISKINQLQNLSKSLPISFKPLKKNPIDLIWETKPAKPSSLITPHPIKYSGLSSKEKIINLCKKIKEIKADAFLICKADTLAWLLNIRGRDLSCTPIILARALVLSNGAVLMFLNKSKLDKRSKLYLKNSVKNIKFYEETALFDTLSNFTNKNIWIDPSITPYAIKHNSKAKTPAFIAKTCPLELPKSIKNKTEIKGAIEAHKKDGVALCKFLFWINTSKEKITEFSASIKIDSLRALQTNYICKSFDTISGFGRNGAIIHYKVDKKSNLEFKKDNLYLVDSGGQYLEGTTDVTRTLAIGNPSKEMIKYFSTVLKAHISLAKIIFPYGTTGNELDIIARKELWSQNMDYGHGTGHGVGSCLSVHEGPQSITKGSKIILEPGMIVSNEPGFYLKNKFGIRIENLMIVQKHKVNNFNNKDMLEFKTLTLAPIDLKLIDYSMLNKEEIEWLNKYNLAVYQNISPKLSLKEKNWLKIQCKKI